MRITGFIRDTPAAELAESGVLSRNDTIVRLAGRSTRSLFELKAARNRLDPDRYAKMIVRKPDGDYYYMWVTVSPPVVTGRPGEVGSGASQGAADEIIPGGEGQGGTEDFRPKDSDGDGGLFGSPAPRGN
jgi:hypothetical protein